MLSFRHRLAHSTELAIPLESPISVLELLTGSWVSQVLLLTLYSHARMSLTIELNPQVANFVDLMKECSFVPC